VRWNRTQRYAITKSERDALIRQAQREHDATLAGLPTPPSPYKIERTPSAPSYNYYDAAEEPAPPTPTPASASTSDDALPLTLDDITPFVEKISEVENRVDQHDAALGELTDMPQRVSALETAAATRVEIVIRNERTSTARVLEGVHHFMFPTLVELALSLEHQDRNIWIAGPAGSGKTTAVHKLAEALELPFEYQGAITNPFELLGFIDAGGAYHSTQFRRMYENGGVWLGDEMDGSSAAALLALNGALANHIAPFPDKMVERHPNFYALAAANTWGFGGDANYVGRNKLDDATLDRFITLSWPYDEAFEASLIGARPKRFTTPPRTRRVDGDTVTPDEWINVVHSVRDKARANSAKIIVSPRASIKGWQLLQAGLSRALVVEAIFGRYRTHTAWASIGSDAEAFSRRDLVSPVTAPAPATNTNGAISDREASALKVDMSSVKVY